MSVWYANGIVLRPLRVRVGQGAAKAANIQMRRWLVEMKVVCGDVAGWEDEWQALHLFSAFAFRRVRMGTAAAGEVQAVPKRAAGEGQAYDIKSALRL